MQLMRDKHNRWTMQVQGSEHSWYMGRRPDVLLLVADSQRSLSSWGDPEPDILRRDVVAWFAYGKQGHWAGKSGEIGRLVVPRRTAEDQPSLEFLDQAISSLTAVVAHWRNEGRLLANPDFDLDDLGPKRFQLEGE